MNPDEFEQKLQRQPLRKIPAAWRDEILAAARTAAVPRHPTPATRYSPWWRDLFWPAPQAWAGMAALWVVIFGLRLATHDAAQLAGSKTSEPPELVAALRPQKLLFAELAGTSRSGATRAPASAPSRPRSMRR